MVTRSAAVGQAGLIATGAEIGLQLAYFPLDRMASILRPASRYCTERGDSPLGHEAVLTTLNSYGHLASRRQGEIIHDLGKPRPQEQPGADEIVETVLRTMGHSLAN